MLININNDKPVMKIIGKKVCKNFKLKITFRHNKRCSLRILFPIDWCFASGVHNLATRSYENRLRLKMTRA